MSRRLCQGVLQWTKRDIAAFFQPLVLHPWGTILLALACGTIAVIARALGSE